MAVAVPAVCAVILYQSLEDEVCKYWPVLESAIVAENVMLVLAATVVIVPVI